MDRPPRIRIGTQSAASAATILAPFQYAVEHGFEAFEWLPDKNESGAGWEEKDVDAETRRYIRETSLKEDIHVSVHAPWHLNPSNPNHRERFSETIGFAEDIGASLFNLHLYTEQGMDAYAWGIIPLTDTLAQSSIRLSVENTVLTGPEDFNVFFKRLGDLAPDAMAHVGMCLDIGHANLCEATQNDYLKFIDLLAPEVPIIHIHLHENYGDFDSHLTVFTGPSKTDDRGIRGFVRRMKKRSFSGSIILEQWPDQSSLLNEAREKLRAMFGEPFPTIVHTVASQKISL
jgi:sugar phosphate isomerase/epimerase